VNPSEIVFYPDGGGGFLIGFGIFVAALGVLFAAAMAFKDDKPSAGAWFGAAVFIVLGAALAIWPSLEARAVTVRPDGIVLHYRFPHPDVRLELGEIGDVRIEYAGTEKPSPHLVVETRTGDKYEGEGTNQPFKVDEAKSAIRRLLLKQAQ
jgi:hypothetical protein